MLEGITIYLYYFTLLCFVLGIPGIICEIIEKQEDKQKRA